MSFQGHERYHLLADGELINQFTFLSDGLAWAKANVVVDWDLVDTRTGNILAHNHRPEPKRKRRKKR